MAVLGAQFKALEMCSINSPLQTVVLVTVLFHSTLTYKQLVPTKRRVTCTKLDGHTSQKIEKFREDRSENLISNHHHLLGTKHFIS
jgi:hypothetical protein